MVYVEREMANFNIPIVVLDSTSLVTGASRIRSDDIDGCRQAIAHLTGLGHKRIGYIGGNAVSVASILRLEGYRRAMKEHGLPVLRGYETQGNWDPAVVTQVTERLFSGEAPHPTAVFCADDKTAMTACATIRRMGMSIPGDVSVVGFADLSMAPFNDPPLTTVAQPFAEMGRAAICRLMAASDEDEDGYSEANRDQLLPTRLIVRQSSGPAAS
jgi:DNA-binding LacI/PurR family transcriptional regulator